MAEFQNLIYQVSEGIALITINRPDARNALNAPTTAELKAAAEQAAVDPDVLAVIITGAGEKAFAAGADIKALHERKALEVFQGNLSEVCSIIQNLPKPTIAAVNGVALGGGCELSMACDIRIASESARFGQPEVNLGILAGAGGTQRLARLIGIGRALELLMTGDVIDAQEAYRIGLANKVVPVGQAVEAAREMARKIMAKGQVAVRLSKLACLVGSSVDINSGLMVERLAQAVLFSTEDKREGTTAFIEKRPPEFKGK